MREPMLNDSNISEDSTEKLTLFSLILISSYIVTQLLASIASVKIVSLYGFEIDAGTFIFPVSFMIFDMIHKKLGKKTVLHIVYVSAGASLVMSAFFAFVTWLPPCETWLLQDAWNSILAPVWRIVFASIIATFCSDVVDTEVYHFWITRITKKYQWSRILVSNLASIPIDSTIFAWIAFAGTLPAETVWGIVLSNCIIKFIVTVATLPSIYFVKGE